MSCVVTCEHVNSALFGIAILACTIPWAAFPLCIEIDQGKLVQSCRIGQTALWLFFFLAFWAWEFSTFLIHSFIIHFPTFKSWGPCWKRNLAPFLGNSCSGLSPAHVSVYWWVSPAAVRGGKLCESVTHQITHLWEAKERSNNRQPSPILWAPSGISNSPIPAPTGKVGLWMAPSFSTNLAPASCCLLPELGLQPARFFPHCLNSGLHLQERAWCHLWMLRSWWWSLGHSVHIYPGPLCPTNGPGWYSNMVDTPPPFLT